MPLPLVTVLMPNHNGERFIAQTIESVLSQTYENFEFLIVEDASSDRSADIIRGYSDPRIRVIQLEKNGHICNALNTGLAQAKGKYIARIDSDDCWLPEKLALQVTYLEDHPDCGGCFTWVNVIDEDDQPVLDSFFNTQFHTENCSRQDWVRRFYFEGCRLCHPSAVIPHAVFEKLGYYDLAYVQIQDFDMWSRIAKSYPLHVIETPLMNYRYVENSNNVSAQSESVNRRTLCEFSMVISHYFDDMTDVDFAGCFRQDFIREDASSHLELECERALLLLRPLFCGYAAKMSGIQKLHALLNNSEARRILADCYGITQMEFYQLTASPVLYEESATLAGLGRKALIKEVLSRTMRRALKKQA